MSYTSNTLGVHVLVILSLSAWMQQLIVNTFVAFCWNSTFLSASQVISIISHATYNYIRIAAGEQHSLNRPINFGYANSNWSLKTAKMGSRWLIDKQKPEHSHIHVCRYSFTLTSIVPLFPPIATVFPKASSSTSRKALIAISLLSWLWSVLLISDHGSQLFKGNSSNESHPTCCKNTNEWW